MSVNQPPPIGGGAPTAAPTAQGPLPGASLQAQGPTSRGDKLRQMFGQTLIKWGNAVIAGDGTAVAIAQNELQQVIKEGQAQGKAQGQPSPVQPRTGVPTPVDGSRDATTGI